MSFILKTAWRDSRRSRSRLLLFMSAIVLGIAALVAINSFGDNLARSIDEQAQELLGADLTVTAAQVPSQKTRNLLQGIGTERSSETAFASMVLFPRSGGVRLAQVKALEGRFPYYGTWEVEPASAVARFRGNNVPVALVDEALLVQFGANVGDSVRVGEVTFLVAGRVLKTPGGTAATAAVAPTVFVPATYLNRTGLVQKGSRVNYKYYYKFAPGTDVPALVNRLEPTLDKAGLSTDTVANRKRQTGRAFADLTRFLNLVSFVALLLGCVGVASAVQLYVKEKITSVAVLRTLGASGWQAFLIFLVQTAVMGLGGAVLGAALGSVVQWLMPVVFGSFLPVEVSVALSWSAIGQGIVTGLLIALLFAALPLLLIRNVSPLRTLRASLDTDVSGRDPLRWLVVGLIIVFVFGFAWWQTHDWKLAGGFTAGMAVSFLVLTGMGLLLMAAVRRFFPRSWSFVWRQSLANLYRPQNQTLILLVSIGLGAFLITTLYLTQTLLLSRVQFSASGEGGGARPNMVLFDIQREQTAGVRSLVQRSGLPVIQQVPIVTMRLESINGRNQATLRKDTSMHVPDWAMNREYRVTYRDSLIASEKLSAGKVQAMTGGVPSVTFEENFMQRLHVKIGDKLTFNVQGAPIETVVGGTRSVDWNRVQTNFILVFPSGVLEQAPQFSVLMTRVPNTQKSAQFQRALVNQFPNVSAIDLGLILKTLDDILDKISFVIRFMALFSILTGLLVLSSSVIISKYQRMQESVLLRTLGASRRQILRITLVEYGLLGVLASLSGIILSVLGTWVLARYVFEMPYAPSVWPLLAVVGTITALTALIGLLNSRDVVARSPLDVLRSA